MKHLIQYLNSPFKTPKLKFYLGKIAIGTPYFLPRKTIKDPLKPGHLKFVRKKFGYDFVRLGWKTKWTDTDYRWEWSPLFSFVIGKIQLAIIIKVENPDHYWTSWLYYHRNTDKSKSVSERVKQCVEEFPQTYKVTTRGKTKVINYYDSILKKKWIQSKESKRDRILKKLGI